MADEPQGFLRFFIDESGLPDPYIRGINNPSEQYFTLCAVAIEQKDYTAFKRQARLLHKRYYKYLNNQEIKSRSIRRSNPIKIDSMKPPEYDFWKYDDGLLRYQQFCKDLKSILSTTDFEVISVTVDKEFAQSHYPEYDILTTALNDLWERICIFKYIHPCKRTRIIFDPRSRLSDSKVRESYNNFLKSGTMYVEPHYVKSAKLFPAIYSPNSSESFGLQLADLFAYPIRAFHERGDSQYFTDNVAPKLAQLIFDPNTSHNVHMSLKMTLSK